MKREKSLPVRLMFCIGLLALTLPFFGVDCFVIRGDEAGIEIHIENQGQDPMHFSYGIDKTRIAVGKSELVAEYRVPAPKGNPNDGEAVLKMNRMDIDFGTLRISVPGTALKAGEITKISIRMNEPEYYNLMFSCQNPAVVLDYQRP